MEIKKALYISQELSPYLPSTPENDLLRATAQGIQENGVEVRTFMPKYGMINERRNQLHEVIRLSGLNIEIDDADHPLVIKVATLQPTRMQVYFIDNEDYFGVCDNHVLETEGHPEDNDERIIFFARGVIETVKKLRWAPELVCCTGWVTALVPIYMRLAYADEPTVRDSRIVFGLHGNSLQGTLDPRFVEKLKQEGFTDEQLASLGNGSVGNAELCKLAIDYSDAVVQTVPDADPELIAYAKASGKPFLEFPESENAHTTFVEFFKSL